MCMQGGKSTKDFCKMTDEKIVKMKLADEILHFRQQACMKQFGVWQGASVLKRSHAKLSADGYIGFTKKSIEACDAIEKHMDEYVNAHLAEVNGVIDHDVKKTADFYRLLSKIRSKLVSMDHPSESDYKCLARAAKALGV